MKTGNKRIFLLLSLILVCVFLTSCDTWDSFSRAFLFDKSDTDKEIYIGVFEPQSGEFQEEGLSEIKGIELANTIYNNVNGADVKLIKADNKSDTVVGQNVIKGLVEMQPVAIIGSVGEANSLIASSYIEDKEIPTITPSAVNPLITQDNPYYFRACLTESQMGAGLSEYVYQSLGSRNIGIFSLQNDSVMETFLDGFKQGLNRQTKDYAKSIKFENLVSMTHDKTSEIVESIKKSGVDCVFIPIGTNKLDNIFTEIEKAKLTNITFIGNKSWGSEEFVNMMKKHPDIKVAFPYAAVLSASRYKTSILTEETQRFQIEYANYYGEDDIPTDNAARGYDAYLILINAIHKANSTNGDDIRRAITQLNGIKCATGVFSFDNNGNIIRAVNISTIIDGEVRSLYVTTQTSKAEKIEELAK